MQTLRPHGSNAWRNPWRARELCPARPWIRWNDLIVSGLLEQLVRLWSHTSGVGKTRPAHAPTAAPIGENANSEKRTAPIEAVAPGAFMRKGCTAAIALLCSPGILAGDPVDGSNNSISIRRSADSTCDIPIVVVISFRVSSKGHFGYFGKFPVFGLNFIVYSADQGSHVKSHVGSYKRATSGVISMYLDLTSTCSVDETYSHVDGNEFGHEHWC